MHACLWQELCCDKLRVPAPPSTSTRCSGRFLDPATPKLLLAPALAAALQLPASSAMAVNLRAKTEAEEQERAEIKRLVLKANRQQEASSEQAVPLMHVRQNTLPPGGVPQKAVSGASAGLVENTLNVYMLQAGHVVVYSIGGMMCGCSRCPTWSCGLATCSRFAQL